jgi:anaerobic selenocysteine-containing dehydrogenase
MNHPRLETFTNVRRVRGACPLDCPDTCSWIVTVKGDEAVALRGDPQHPYTRGSLCNKVADYLNYARSPDRLLYPMRRVGPKGSASFIRISWDEGIPTLLIHPDDAAPRGIAAGDEVRVGNARGSFLAIAEVADRVRPGVVASAKERWPCYSKGNSTVNATVDERDSDMGGGAVYHDNRVRVDKAS